MFPFRSLLLSISLCITWGNAFACDLCSIYTSLETQKLERGSVHLGLAEQFTYYGTARTNGGYVPNKGREHLASSITQLFGAYDLSDSSSLQLNVPYINRRYTKLDDGVRRRGTEAGIGDTTLLYKHTLVALHENIYRLQAQVYGGVKLPTGDSDQLKGQDEIKPAHLRPLHDGEHHEPEVEESALHGHDLALGSGSFDFPLGFALLGRSERLVASSDVQYMIRTEGDYDYRAANDLLWSLSGGYFLSTLHERTFVLKLNLSGEYKRNDRIGSVRDGSTGIRTIFAGPGALITIGHRLHAEASFDLPLVSENTGTQLTADYRIRAAVNYRF